MANLTYIIQIGGCCLNGCCVYPDKDEYVLDKLRQLVDEIGAINERQIRQMQNHHEHRHNSGLIKGTAGCCIERCNVQRCLPNQPAECCVRVTSVVEEWEEQSAQ